MKERANEIPSKNRLTRLTVNEIRVNESGDDRETWTDDRKHRKDDRGWKS